MSGNGTAKQCMKKFHLSEIHKVQVPFKRKKKRAAAMPLRSLATLNLQVSLCPKNSTLFRNTEAKRNFLKHSDLTVVSRDTQ